MEFHFPQHVQLGLGAGQKVGLAARQAGSRVLVLADSPYEGSRELKVLGQSLDRASVPYLVLVHGVRQGIEESCREALTVAKASHMDILAAVGGPDQLSLGRRVAADLAAEGLVLPYFEVPSAICSPLLLRPEAFCPSLHPSAVHFTSLPSTVVPHIFLDPHLTPGMTPAGAVAGILEACFYAVDLCLHEKTPLTGRQLALGSLSVLWSSLRGIYENPQSADLRAAVVEAGFGVSIALSLTPRLGGLNLALALGGLTGLPTASFGGVLLAPLLDFRADRWGDRLGLVAEALQLGGGPTGVGTVGNRLSQEVRKLMAAYRLPARLSDHHIVSTQLQQSLEVARAMESPRGGALDPDSLGDFVRLIQ